jgi:hypothetical protein
VLKHPAHRYIAYLLSRRNRSASAVIDHLDSIDIPIPSNRAALDTFQKSISATAAAMRIPHGFNPTAKVMSKETSAFLDRYGITEIWRGDRYVLAATDILFEPVLRRSLEAYLLGPLQPGHIALRLQSRYGLSDAAINSRVIRNYAHLYWDPMSMNHSDWRWFIDVFLGGYSRNEDLLNCLMAPRTSAGAAMSLAVVDRSLDSLSSAVIYSTMRDMAFRNYLESSLMMTTGLSKAYASLAYFNAIKGAEDELARHRGTSREFLEEMQRIDAEFDKNKAISVREIPRLPSVQLDIINTTGEGVTHGNE